MSDQLYQENILDYYRHPRNFGVLVNPDIVARDVNPACGDEVSMYLGIENGKVKDVRFSGKGCAISLAASSMLTERIVGRSLDEIAQLKKEDVLELLAIPVSGMRMKCALLGFKVLKLGIVKYLGMEVQSDG